MRLPGISTTLFLLTCIAGRSQTTLTFEVASVKPAAPPQPVPANSGGRATRFGMRGGPGSQDPGQLTATGTTLRDILMRAYSVKTYELTGPAWLGTERFDVVAKVPPGTTKEQFNLMLQNLLAERFHLAVHRETKELPGYDLVVGKNGSKLKETTLAETDPPPISSGPPPIPTGPAKTDPNGFPLLDRAGSSYNMRMGPKGASGHMTARAQAISQLVVFLTNQLSRPVIDKTGLTAKFDYHLEFAPGIGGIGTMTLNGQPVPPSDSLDASDESGPNLMIAIQEQLGLKLEPRKVPTDMLVIDRADKVPTEN